MTLEKRFIILQKRVRKIYQRFYARYERRKNSDAMAYKRRRAFDKKMQAWGWHLNQFNRVIHKNKGRIPVFLSEQEIHRLRQWLRYEPLKTTPDSKWKRPPKGGR